MPPVRVLRALDHAAIQFYHFQAIIIAGMGLFADAYNLFSISPVLKLIGRIYYPPQDGKPGETPLAVSTVVVTMALVGTVVGQLTFGSLGDRFGRRSVYGLAILIMVFSSIGSGFSVCRTRGCVLSSLCLFRFLLGIGIGGDYPLSATIMSEFANVRTRGGFLAAVFSMQGFGILASSGTTMAAAAAFEHATDRSEINPLHTPEAADVLWRVILMLGAVPAALTLYWRVGMPETARYTALVRKDEVGANIDIGKVFVELDLSSIDQEEQEAESSNVANGGGLNHPPPQTYGLFSQHFLKRHGRHLFACSAAWLAVDIPYYSSTLFQSKIYEPWFKPPEHVNAYREAYNVAKFQAIIASASTIPGYYFTVATIDRVGRRPIQTAGFLLMAVFLFALAGPFDAYWTDHTNGWFIVLYALTFFFSNFGPNTTTFIVPAELFPARLRCTCHGIAGAAGKVGAIIGSVGFLWASQVKRRREEAASKRGIGVMNSLFILGGVCVAGAMITFWFTPETRRRSLEENEVDEEVDDCEMEEVGVMLRPASGRAGAVPLDERPESPLRGRPSN